MARLKIPYQNIDVEIPDIGNIFRIESQPGFTKQVSIRTPTGIQSVDVERLGLTTKGFKDVQAANQAGLTSTDLIAIGMAEFTRQTGIDLPTLRKLEGAAGPDLETALRVSTPGGVAQRALTDIGGFQALRSTTPVGGGTVTRELSPINPQGSIARVDNQIVRQALAPSQQRPIPSPNLPPTINSSITSSPQGLNYQSISNAPPSNAGIYTPSDALTQTATTLGKNESEISRRLVEIQASQNQLLGKSTDITSLKESTGFNAQQTLIDDYGSQLDTLRQEAASFDSILKKGAGERGVTTGLFSAQYNYLNRENNVAALTIGALLASTQGRLSSAQRKIDQAIEVKYGPIEEKISVARSNLELLLKDPNITLEQEKRANAQLEIQKMKAEQTANTKAKDQQVLEIAVKAATPERVANFVPSSDYQTATQALDAIKKQTDPVTAQQIASIAFPASAAVSYSVFGTAEGGYYRFNPKTGKAERIVGGAPTLPTTSPPISKEQFRKQLEQQRQQSLPQSIVDSEYQKYLSEKSTEVGQSGSLYDQVKNRRVDLVTLPAEQKKAVLADFAARGELIPRPLTAKEKDAQDQATSGLDAVQQLKTMAENNQLPLVRSYIFGDTAAGRLAGTSQFTNLVKEATDIKTRIRTGAALNEQEISFYASQAPAYGDSEADVKKKLDNLEGFYLGMSGIPVTIQNAQGQSFIFDDLFDSKQRLGLRTAIANGWTVSY